MCSVELNAREATLCHKTRRIHKLTNNLLDILDRHFPRRAKGHPSKESIQIAITQVQWNRAGSNRRGKQASPACSTRGLSACMTDLDNGRGAMFLTGIRILAPALKGLGVVLVVFAGRGIVWVPEMIRIYLDVSYSPSKSSALRVFQCQMTNSLTRQDGTPAALGPFRIDLEEILIGEIIFCASHSLGHGGLERSR